jgi:hypothetical protein
MALVLDQDRCFLYLNVTPNASCFILLQVQGSLKISGLQDPGQRRENPWLTTFFFAIRRRCRRRWETPIDPGVCASASRRKNSVERTGKEQAVDLRRTGQIAQDRTKESWGGLSVSALSLFLPPVQNVTIVED